MNSANMVCIVIVLLLFGGGCASDKPSRVILKHPETQDFVNCNVDKWESAQSYRTNEECIRTYEEQGYFIWGKR